MTPVKIILVPTDFSPASRRALRYACNLADAFGASLHIIHVLDILVPPPGYPEIYGPPPGDYLEEIGRRARAELEAQLTSDEKTRYSATFVMRAGSPAREILEYLKDQEAIDLVVMATAGRGGVARLMMGSVADKVVRAAPCPVLTLHPDNRADAESTYRAA
jgi:nucleotide-binding universal stress UspA family protein